MTGASAEFRKAKSSNWQTVGPPPPSTSDQATADAILAAAAREANEHHLAVDEAPIVDNAHSIPKMESGAHAGLQSASQVTAQLQRQQASDHARFLQDGDEHSGRNAETIYRDASGRIINIAMKRAEARSKAASDAAAAAAALEAQKGDVQRAARSQARADLAEAKFLPVARHADDEAMNEEMRERERWNDPAAGFLKKKDAGKSVTGKPLYAGPAMPNRYGIRPGWRWDGVDRGNGFEKEYFRAANRRRNMKDLDYAWQMDE